MVTATSGGVKVDLVFESLSERRTMKPVFDCLESRDVPSSMFTPGTYADAMTPIYGAVASVTGSATGAVADTVMGSSTLGSTILIGSAMGAQTVIDTQINPDGSLNTSRLSSSMNVPIYTQPLPNQPSTPTSPQVSPQVKVLA